jgi:nitrogen fixation NifU-like protein
MATELIKGQPVSEVKKLTNKAVAEALDGLPDYKMHCSVLAAEAIQSALEDYQKRTGKNI